MTETMQRTRRTRHGSETRRRRVQVNVRLTEDEYRNVVRTASDLGISLQELFRRGVESVGGL